MDFPESATAEVMGLFFSKVKLEVVSPSYLTFGTHCLFILSRISRKEWVTEGVRAQKKSLKKS